MNSPLAELFDSRDIRYKSVFGPLPLGQRVRLRLFLPLEAHSPVLLWHEDGGPVREQPLAREEDCGGGCFWGSWLEPNHTGLYFYTFRYQGPRGEVRVGRGPYNRSVTQGWEDWQLTVYDPAFTTPQWAGGGVMYQIFPDRFFSSGQPKKGVPADRYLVGEWGGQPAYWQGDGGRVLNNDYWGGDLAGILQKLDYLQALGVTCLYLNPIFEAHSNHRYNTADSLRIDPLLGSQEDFTALCRACHERGMKVVLDGVFSHTGADSRYFNQAGRYPDQGAAQSPDSPYFNWYTFTRYPDQYKAWWGMPSLPEVNEEEASFLQFITGEDGVLRRWLRAGADGWRLDVADELPDRFLDELRRAVKAEKGDALILGEVWEDASQKFSYDGRRRYLLGAQLDSVMNYPFREAVLRFLKGGDSADLMETVLTILEHYPKPAVDALMNHLGTHDTERLITALAGEEAAGRGREWQARQCLSAGQLEKGLKFVRLAALLQYTLPGFPCLYYGDEISMQGYSDPFNRAPYHWGGGSAALKAFYQKLGRLRKACPAFAGGEFTPVYAGTGHIAYLRAKGEERILVAVNRWCDPEPVDLPAGWEDAVVLCGNAPEQGRLWVPAEGFSLLGKGTWVQKI